ncbi:unnamed protein product [Sphagnum tenellum]
MFLRRPMDIPAKDWISGNLAAEVSQRARVDADDGSVGDQESSTLDDLKRARKTLRPVLNVVIIGLNAVGAGKPMELACACKQTRHCQCVEKWFKFRGTAYARSVATRYRLWAKGWRLADMPFRSKECLKRMPTSYPDHLSGCTNVI